MQESTLALTDTKQEIPVVDISAQVVSITSLLSRDLLRTGLAMPPYSSTTAVVPGTWYDVGGVGFSGRRRLYVDRSRSRLSVLHLPAVARGY